MRQAFNYYIYFEYNFDQQNKKRCYKFEILSFLYYNQYISGKMMPSHTITMQQFYQNVINDFGNRLYNKYNQKQQSFDSQMIDQIKIRLNAKMRNTKQLFKRALQRKRPKSTAMQEAQRLMQLVKKQENQQSPQHHNDQEIDYAIIFQQQLNNNASHNNGHHQSGTIVPGLLHRIKNVNNIINVGDTLIVEEGNQKLPEVKKQQTNQDGLIKHQPQDGYDQRNQEDQIQKQMKLESVNKNLTVHIVGTYQRAAKRHIAKDQTTKIELQNVFIKIKDKNDQIFLSKLTCQFKDSTE